MRQYSVSYRLYQNADAKYISVKAGNKIEAYDTAVYELIPAKEGQIPYSAWVDSITYANGSVKLFNNFEGKPY